MLIQIKTAKIISGVIFKTCDKSNSKASFNYYIFDLFNDMNVADKKLIKDISGKIRYKGILNLPKKSKFL